MRICSWKLLIFETQYHKFNFMKNQAYLKHVCIHPLIVRLTSDYLWEIEQCAILFVGLSHANLHGIGQLYIHITLVTWSDGLDHVKWVHQEHPDHTRRSRVWSGRSWHTHETWTSDYLWEIEQCAILFVGLLHSYLHGIGQLYIHIITLVMWSDGLDHVKWVHQEHPDHTRWSGVWSGPSWHTHETWSYPSDQVTKVMLYLLYTYKK